MTAFSASVSTDGPEVFDVVFKSAKGAIVPAPAGVSFTSTNGATLSFDGVSKLTVGETAVGADSITAGGLAGELDLTVTEPVAASVEFSGPVA